MQTSRGLQARNPYSHVADLVGDGEGRRQPVVLHDGARRVEVAHGAQLGQPQRVALTLVGVAADVLPAGRRRRAAWSAAPAAHWEDRQGMARASRLRPASASTALPQISEPAVACCSLLLWSKSRRAGLAGCKKPCDQRRDCSGGPKGAMLQGAPGLKIR